MYFCYRRLDRAISEPRKIKQTVNPGLAALALARFDTSYSMKNNIKSQKFIDKELITMSDSREGGTLP